MLSHSRCLSRTLGRSLSALSQGKYVLAGRTASGLSAGNRVVYRNSQSRFESLSSVGVFHVRYFKTSAAHRDEVVTVNTPPFSESITEGDVRWEKAVGDSVKEDEVVCEIETDKTSLQVPSPAAGVITELLVPDGGRVEAGNPLFKLQKGAAAAASVPAAEAPAAAAAPTPAAIPVAMPAVPPVPTQAAQAKPVSAVKPSAARAEPAAVAHGARTESRVKMNRMRLRIAQRLKEAQQTCAMLTTFNEIDMRLAPPPQLPSPQTNPYPRRLKDPNNHPHEAKSSTRSPPPCLFPSPVIDDTTKEIVYRDYVDISVAVATPKGLVVPVIRNVETMNFADIEKTINGLGEKARNNLLAVEDMDGGTFTISNGGVFGSMFGTPIINPPQSAILGMHGIFDRPVAIGGKVEIRPMMYVALTYDHRLVDGREAVTFLRKIKSVVEDPRVLLLDM
ncbi:dihydrolipoyllysine-residue succinyltransferase component of 2-oxoglutarate dehydrogenase complex, mitochondrial [Salvelinus sp. IW2-2015]|uniref:dihydrolipoyllysine-residue succinyltransferase component of 2-oxoglutarate dehydrogenase complex, mitochondrial n=1 Tax=Salvelinus sp. IW2-2015 TaxID=2691554 RepID=UPI000CEAEAE5|nr:dihydrolipoyllysine-residue succinyltransferase component of 2-oxoglutarate dehydrogenase complex, mitochondrial-like [Salvelinus alpinus]